MYIIDIFVPTRAERHAKAMGLGYSHPTTIRRLNFIRFFVCELQFRTR